MNKVPSCEQECKAGVIIAAFLLAIICANVTGCVPAITGIKSYQSGQTRIDFITGGDFGFSVNGTDTVKNQRGISPANRPFNETVMRD